MKLISLHLINFQGVKEFTLEANGADVSVYGDNATGKTTVFNAFTWLLFGAPSTGAKGFTPKTRTRDGEAHGLDHTVSAVIEDNGVRTSLTKIFREIYKKKRGSIREEFDGHTTEYFVNGVPCKEKEYAGTVGGFFGDNAELAKILTMPEFFSEVLPWERRRAYLIDLCGDVSDEDVFASEDQLSDLKRVLEGRTVEEESKMLAARRRALNEKLSEMPGRLDEAQRAAQFGEIFSIDAAQKTLEDLEEEKRALIEERANLHQTATEDKRKQLAGLEADLSEAATSYRMGCIEQTADARAILASLREDLACAEGELHKLEREKRSAMDAKEDLERRRADLLAEHGKVAALTFDESATVCPCCHRPLPEEEIVKLREDFNLQRSARLAEINERGKREASRETIGILETNIAEISARIADATKRVSEAKNAVAVAEHDLPFLPPFEDTETYRSITGRINAVRAEISDAAKTYATALAEQDVKIRAVNDRISPIRDDMARYHAAERQRARVEELVSEQKQLAKEYEETERLIYLCELFTKTKVSLLTSRVGDRFKHVRFSLFVEQINGGVKEECEVLVPSEDGSLVPFVFANNAARINAGIEIIGAISEHYGISLPLFIDNAEGVTRLAESKTQTIRLVVSEKDKALRVEVAC